MGTAGCPPPRMVSPPTVTTPTGAADPRASRPRGPCSRALGPGGSFSPGGPLLWGAFCHAHQPQAPGPWRPSFADAPGQSLFVALGMGLCLPCTQVRQRLLAERLPYRQSSFRQSEISLGLGVGGSPSLPPAPLPLLQRDQPLCLSPF